MLIKIDESSANQRLDRFLIKLFPKAPRGEIFRMIRKKDVRINGSPAKENTRIRFGDELSIYLSQERRLSWTKESTIPRAGELNIIYEDHEDLVVFKAQGLKTTPDRSGEDSLTGRVQAYLVEELSPTFRPSPLGRLDKDTQGLILFGKNYQRTKMLEELQRQGRVEKSYMALIFGTIREGLCELSLEKNKTGPGVRVTSGEKKAKTFFKELARQGDYSLVEAKLITGKTHQIRVSIAHLGARLVGDELYGKGLGGQKLVCYRLSWLDKDISYVPNEFIEELRKVGINEGNSLNFNK